MLPKTQEAAFQELVGRAHDNGIFTKENTTLFFLTAALATGCKQCTARFLNQAKEQHIDEQAVGMVTAIAMCVRAGGLRAALMEINEDQAELSMHAR